MKKQTFERGERRWTRILKLWNPIISPLCLRLRHSLIGEREWVKGLDFF
jgi:hypothetical protein